MNPDYADIRDRIAEPPKWWDENGTPRYCEFAPDEVASFYAEEVALVVIACQSCEREFRVALSVDSLTVARGGAWLSDAIQEIHYGDPPNVQCCPSGPTMNSVPKRVVEFWSSRSRMADARFVRVPSLEVEIKCDWANDA